MWVGGGGGGGKGGGGLNSSLVVNGNVGIAVLFNAASWVRSSSGDNFSSRGGFPLGVNMGSDSIPLKLFRMRV